MPDTVNDTTIDVTDDIEDYYGDLVRLRCICGATVEWCHDCTPDDISTCPKCGRRFKFTQTIRVELLP